MFKCSLLACLSPPSAQQDPQHRAALARQSSQLAQRGPSLPWHPENERRQRGEVSLSNHWLFNLLQWSWSPVTMETVSHFTCPSIHRGWTESEGSEGEQYNKVILTISPAIPGRPSSPFRPAGPCRNRQLIYYEKTKTVCILSVGLIEVKGDLNIKTVCYRWTGVPSVSSESWEPKRTTFPWGSRWTRVSLKTTNMWLYSLRREVGNRLLVLMQSQIMPLASHTKKEHSCFMSYNTEW